MSEHPSAARSVRERLPPLDRRLRRRELERIEAAAAARGGLAPATLLALAEEQLGTADAARARLEALRAEHARASSDRERARVIERALVDEGAPARARKAARRGWLDLDAMAERSERTAHEAELLAGLCFKLAAACSDEAAIAPRLVAELHRRSSGRIQLALVEALVELTARLPDAIAPADRQELAGALARLGDRPRRLQAAWATLALALDAEHARAAIRARLEWPAARDDDFVVRQHLIKLLGARSGDRAAFFLLASRVQSGPSAERSEHVRIAMAGALVTTGGVDALPLLRSLSAPPPTGDPCPRVRAAAVIALAELARSHALDVSAEVARHLGDADPLVARIAAEELAALADAGRVDARALVPISRIVGDAALAASSPAAADPALGALESIVQRAAPELAAAREQIAEVVDGLMPGASRRIQSALSPVELGRVLAALARDRDGLYAQPVPGGYRVWRGARFVRRAWRIWHELRARTPYKRQDGVHTIGRHFAGTLRAHPTRMAEATRTLPGEPVYLPDQGGWGAHLPTVDDLLSTSVLRGGVVSLFTPRGISRIVTPSSLGARLRARLALSHRYEELADLRVRALSSADPSERTRYVDALAKLGFQLSMEPYPTTGGVETPLAPAVAAPFGGAQAAAAASSALALVGTPDGLADAIRFVTSTGENTLGQLGLAALGLFGVLIARNLMQRDRVRRDRAAIPLVVGGWGTRGKSGTERLKAALFHGLDVEVLVKTTGCEAMFIHGVPGRRPTEIFIHRNYDKATIWEQRDLLALAARLRVPVFLYECMALAGPLVSVVQDEWMHDDLSTLTNAYPDHEDIQGPAGHDIARSIAGFIGGSGVTLTTEEQMLPVFVEEAKRKQARLVVVPWREHALLADDLLARLPYQEHPRNVALVRRLAVELGDDPDLATADMADHVVPDLGVLKAYPEAAHRGRRLTFVNGMSANERTGFVSNWERTGCERSVDEATRSGRWVVTVVNNRYDRVARSKAFADILVRDATAERHVLIGTNLGGLVSYANEALERYLDENALFRDDDREAHLEAAVQARLSRMRHRLRVGPAAADEALAELGAWAGVDASPLRSTLEAALTLARERAASATATLAELTGALADHPLAAEVGALVGDGLGRERAAFVARGIARRALVDTVERAAARALSERPERAAACALQRRVHRELFADMLVPLWDAGASGDQVIDFVAAACPPGARVTLMGTQNIKGTGLDFVYRFLRWDEVSRELARLDGADGDTAHAVASALANRSDWGILDAPVAAGALRAAAERLDDRYLADVAAQIDERTRAAHAAVAAGAKRKRSLTIRVTEKTFDALDAIRRRRHAERVLDALVHREISHERAALEMRRLNDREKKGWLR